MDKTLFFDYDGTLHESIKVYYPAFLKAHNFLVSQEACETKEWTKGEVARWLGFNKEEMWKSFMSNLEGSLKDKAGMIIGMEMDRLTVLGEASLYNNVESTLLELKERGYILIFVSNCSNKYMETHRRTFKLDRFFSDYHTAEMYNYISKSEIVGQIVNQYENPLAIVGDRYKDIEAGKDNGLLTIGCRYGYGSKEELVTSDYIIERIEELLEIERHF